jgi:hypothetical protein
MVSIPIATLLNMECLFSQDVQIWTDCQRNNLLRWMRQRSKFKNLQQVKTGDTVRLAWFVLFG